jgi:phospholipid/cholesterol/gamma-HCH transport system substrate-binding protein
VSRGVGGALVRVAVFAAVCLVAMFALVAVFGQLRFGSKPTYRAEFTNVSGLVPGNFVRIAGVEVGKIEKVTITEKATAVVDFTVDDTVALTQGSRALVRYQNLIGDRYLALVEGPGELKKLRPGDTIPISQTAPALDVDALIGGFRPLFQALNPDQINSLTGEIIRAFQGEGGTITALLEQTAEFTSTLADRDQLIGDVIANLNTVLGSVASQSKQFDTALTSLSDLVGTLSAHKGDVSDFIGNADASAKTITSLLAPARPPLRDVVREADRAATLVDADHEWFDSFLASLPDAYKLIGRQGLYGDFFNFYLCQIVIKTNGKGGQPVYVQVAKQVSGRCTPK